MIMGTLIRFKVFSLIKGYTLHSSRNPNKSSGGFLELRDIGVSGFSTPEILDPVITKRLNTP